MSNTTTTGTSGMEMGKKIIIGAVSTIIAALVIYFIVERGGGDRQRKKATLNAWNSYEQNKDIFQKVMTDLGQTMQQGGQDIEQAKSNLARDIDISISNMENIKNEDNVDNRLLSMVDIKTSQLRDMKAILFDMIGKMEATEQTNITFQQLQEYAASMLEETAYKLKERIEKDKIRSGSFRDELCKKYGSTICRE